MNVDELAKIFEESVKHNKNPYAIALDHFKKELVKKMNDLLDGAIKCNKQYSSYAAAFGYLKRGIEFLIEDIEK